ncbi:MAG: bifunctional 5,10-methylenetetrahydrofolate dehydrogenase/5,10-methenyltetrahydrofolate cyclohydrolase, partial [Enterococcus sp.]|nr:bifunctional 5,10-methylenetetrahydrofolate dehydrogenase/5,10-methenyltetrahydrofolate cyclohydrolase [Enterococcus sp.]
IMLLKGKPVSEKIEKEIRERVIELKESGRNPCLAILRVGEKPSDLSYEKNIVKKADELGIKICTVVFANDENLKTEVIIERIKELNDDDGTDGIMLFRPLPRNLDEKAICETISPSKDVDSVTSSSLYSVLTDGEEGFAPCTAEAGMETIRHYGIDLTGKNALVIGRSLVIGKPIAMMLLKENASVTIAHSKTPSSALIDYVNDADVIVSAAGKIDLITADMIKSEKKKVLIDVGINFDDEGRLTGDVNRELYEMENIDITPVPGGLGGVTTTVLLNHLVKN